MANKIEMIIFYEISEKLYTNNRCFGCVSLTRKKKKTLKFTCRGKNEKVQF